MDHEFRAATRAFLESPEDPNTQTKWISAAKRMGALGEVTEVLDAHAHDDLHLLRLVSNAMREARWTHRGSTLDELRARLDLPNKRSHASKLLTEIGRPAIPLLIDVLTTHNDWQVRRQAARSLGRMKGKAASATPALVESLADKEVTGRYLQATSDFVEDVHWASATALMAIGPSTTDAVVPALAHSLSHVRLAALKILRSTDNLQPRHLQPLLAGLEAGDYRSKAGICELLPSLKGHARPALEQLKALSDDHRKTLSQSAGRAFRSINRSRKVKSAESASPEPKTAKPKTAKPKTAKPKTAKPKTAKPKTAKQTVTGSSVLAIVSKKLFSQDCKVGGALPSIGDVVPLRVYKSKNKGLEPLGKEGAGRLFLVTVRPPEALWLVAVLVAPAFQGAQWVSPQPNTVPLTDISQLRSVLKFTSGKGITSKAGALGMSLQTPRQLTLEDVAALQAAIS